MDAVSPRCIEFLIVPTYVKWLIHLVLKLKYGKGEKRLNPMSIILWMGPTIFKFINWFSL
jgi:hypothetical protein